MVYRCQSISFSALVLLALCSSTTNGFHSPSILGSRWSTTVQRDETDTTSSILLQQFQKQQRHHHPKTSTTFARTTTTTTTTLFMAKMWERLKIDEDEEPMWYLLNCVAGLEMDLLRQCRQRCEGMDDVVKFVLPMTKKIRSHGANRMVTETKTQYQGYVFAKLRLCADTYHAIQELDLCRSWMGTINHKGYKKLPPRPVALNEEEIEKFGLEDLEDSEEEDDEEDDGVILDTAEQDAADDLKDSLGEKEALKVYLGYRVNDMVKVTAQGKLFKEDGIVRRLKDGKIMVRFYTYGQMYDEWLGPADVRKLDNVEILKGLSGPTQPITQRDFEGPEFGGGGGDSDSPRQRVGGLGPSSRGGGRDAFGGGGSGGSGEQRNRREDRTATRFRDDRQGEAMTNEKNWNWYKENQSRNQGDGYSDDGGKTEFRGSNDRNAAPQRDMRGSNGDRNFAQRDVDSQWGRGAPPPPRPQRNNNDPRAQQEPLRRSPDTNSRPTRVQQQNSNTPNRNGQNNDWSTFVSPAASKPARGKNDGSDDFFSSLMSDLSGDGKRSGPSAAGRASPRSTASTEEDDFFASLMSDLTAESGTTSRSNDKGPVASNNKEDDTFGSYQSERGTSGTKQAPPARKTEDDFFSSLELELGNTLGGDTTASSRMTDNADDFFASLAKEVGQVTESKSSTPRQQKANERASKTPSSSSEEDFFSSLESELGATLGETTPSSKATTSKAASAPTKRQSKASVGSSPSQEGDFFASLEAELGSGMFDSKQAASDGDDFFSKLEQDIASDLEGGGRSNVRQASATTMPTTEKEKSSRMPKTSKAEAPATTTQKSNGAAASSGALEKLTIPALKDMLKERGMKVSGTKAALIERLSSSS